MVEGGLVLIRAKMDDGGVVWRRILLWGFEKFRGVGIF